MARTLTRGVKVMDDPVGMPLEVRTHSPVAGSLDPFSTRSASVFALEREQDEAAAASQERNHIGLANYHRDRRATKYNVFRNSAAT
jgi:hypothetical protein